LAALLAFCRHTSSVASLVSPLPFFVLNRTTSFRCRVVLTHSVVPLVLWLLCSWLHQGNKKPCFRFG
jgi:hypothetical protein